VRSSRPTTESSMKISRRTNDSGSGASHRISRAGREHRLLSEGGDTVSGQTHSRRSLVGRIVLSLAVIDANLAQVKKQNKMEPDVFAAIVWTTVPSRMYILFVLGSGSGVVGKEIRWFWTAMPQNCWCQVLILVYIYLLSHSTFEPNQHPLQQHLS
jgi:hypothetical protein